MVRGRAGHGRAGSDRSRRDRGAAQRRLRHQLGGRAVGGRDAARGGGLRGGRLPAALRAECVARGPLEPAPRAPARTHRPLPCDPAAVRSRGGASTRGRGLRAAQAAGRGARARPLQGFRQGARLGRCGLWQEPGSGWNMPHRLPKDTAPTVRPVPPKAQAASVWSQSAAAAARKRAASTGVRLGVCPRLRFSRRPQDQASSCPSTLWS